MSNKEIALSYLKQGLSVIPVTSPQMISPDTPEKEMIEKCKRPLYRGRNTNQDCRRK